MLPYGEPKDDWLSIDADYTRRRRTLDLLQDWTGNAALPAVTEESKDKDAPLVHLRTITTLARCFSRSPVRRPFDRL